MGFSLSFKNLGHYFAVGAKYVATGISDVVKFAAKSQAVAPEVDALVGALAGPQAAGLSDLAFKTLGNVAAALDGVQGDASQLATNGVVNIPLDVQSVNDVKAAAASIEAIFKALGAQKPAATAPQVSK